MMTLQDIEHIEEANTVGIRLFTVLTSFLGDAMLKADIWTSFEFLKIVTQAVYSGTEYYLTGKVTNTTKDIIYFLTYCFIGDWQVPRVASAATWARARARGAGLSWTHQNTAT